MFLTYLETFYTGLFTLSAGSFILMFSWRLVEVYNNIHEMEV